MIELLNSHEVQTVFGGEPSDVAVYRHLVLNTTSEPLVYEAHGVRGEPKMSGIAWLLSLTTPDAPPIRGLWYAHKDKAVVHCEVPGVMYNRLPLDGPGLIGLQTLIDGVQDAVENRFLAMDLVKGTQTTGVP